MRHAMVFVFIFMIFGSAFACQFAEPIACKQPTLQLNKHSMGELRKRVKTYGSLLQQFSGLKKSDKKVKWKTSGEDLPRVRVNFEEREKTTDTG